VVDLGVYKRSLGFVIIMLLSVTSPLYAQQLAFPGAEGHGAFSEGGRNGELLIVDNLDDNGPGSLRDAVNQSGPRTIVFETSGIIDLDSTLVISDPYITIAGQTAPGEGITIRGEQVAIQTHDVIIRFIRFRPGDYNERRPDGTDWNGMDAVDIGKENSDEVHDIILDHCSFSWATDELVGIWHTSRNITIQNSIFSEPLHHFPEHEQYPYSGQGLLIGANSTNISILRNLFAHNFDRHPYMNAAGHLDFRNNIIYNAGGRVARLQNQPGKLQTVNFVNNQIISGPSSMYDREISIRRTSITNQYHGKLFIRGNLSDKNRATENDNWEMVFDEENYQVFPDSVRSNSEFNTVQTSTLPAEDLFPALERSVGAYLPLRDAVDQRILSNTAQRNGGMISTTNRVLGWPNKEIITAPIDPDNNWQETYGIDLTIPKEANADHNGSGFTNLEEFLNGTDPLKDESDKLITEAFPPSSATSQGGFGILSSSSIENSFELHKNYPNPFNVYTNIKISIHIRGDYRLEVFDSAGRRVSTILDDELHPGEYEMRWSAGRLSSGNYYMRLSGRGESETRALTLIR